MLRPSVGTIWHEPYNPVSPVETPRPAPDSARRNEINRIRFSMIEILRAKSAREMEKAIRQHLLGWLL